jgi:hypothetical protein
MVADTELTPVDVTAEMTGGAVVVKVELADVPVSDVEVLVEATSKS